MSNDNNDTAAKASIGEVSGCADRVDAQVREVLGRVLAQRRSAGTAFAYVEGLAPGVKANCWPLAEAAGHEGPYRMQALLAHLPVGLAGAAGGAAGPGAGLAAVR